MPDLDYIWSSDLKRNFSHITNEISVTQQGEMPAGLRSGAERGQTVNVTLWLTATLLVLITQPILKWFLQIYQLFMEELPEAGDPPRTEDAFGF